MKDKAFEIPRLKIIGAFAVIYFVWGTTYLAIRFAIETIPPFLMAGTRFIIAGLLLYGWCQLNNCHKPNRADWRKAAFVGLLMFCCGNGGLTWSEQYIPSGFASLIIATIPVWMVLLDWIFFRGNRPDKLTITGIFLGIVGVGLLAGMDHEILIRASLQQGPILIGIFVLLFASIAWATGSLYSRKISQKVSLQLSISMQTIVGGLALLLIGLLRGELGEVSLAVFSYRSVTALIYLIVGGTLLAYSAYIWLLRVSTPAKVGTYAYFNPLVAVLLGWVWIDEPITFQMILGATCILFSIFLVNQS
jgi:drug/metabolite transporter (DMT)-like permease